MDYSEQIANALVAHMEDKGYRYEFDREEGVINTKFRIDSKLGSVRFMIRIKDCFFVSYAYIEMHADKDQRQAVAEYLTRANYGLYLGNFEFDMRDGEIRFKYGVDCDHCLPTSQMIGSSLHIPITMFERYGNELLKVIFGMETPEEAIEIAEGHHD